VNRRRAVHLAYGPRRDLPGRRHRLPAVP